MTKPATPKQLLAGLWLFPIMIICAGAIVIGTPFTFVRVLNLLMVITGSIMLGAFIREWFRLRSE